MKYHIVIARYRENIDWINYIDTNLYDVFIYNKGTKLPNILNCNIIELENKGRETHTYLYHIINNYENLPEKIIFTQANPFDHVNTNFINQINNFNICNDKFFYFSKDILNIQYDSNKNKFFENGILNNKKWENYHELNSPISKVMKKLFKDFKEEHLKIVFGTGAIYGVNKELILRNDKGFYTSCIDILNNSSNLINPDEGHVFERLWFYIFNYQNE
jgi:hypothetical protein